MRWFALLLGAVSVPFVTGCKDSDDGKTKLLVADAATGEASRAAWARAIALFNEKHPDVDIERRIYKDDDYTAYALPTMMRSDHPPDIYFEWAGYAVRRDAREGVAADLTDVLTGPWAAGFDPRSFGGTTSDGRRLMIPDSIDLSNAIWYRKSILARHGIEPPTTWSGFVAACRTLVAAGEPAIVHGNRAGWPAGNWGAHLVERYAGHDVYRQVGELGSSTKLNHPGFVRGLGLLEALAADGAFNRDINTIDDAEAVARFNAKRGAFHFNGLWVLQDLADHEDIGLIGILQLPDVPETPYSVLVTPSGFMIHGKTSHLDLAVELMKIYTSAEVQREAVLRNTLSAIPEAMAAVDRPALLEQAVKLVFEADHFVAAPDISWHPKIADRFYGAVKSVVEGKATAKDALDAATRERSS